MNCHVFLPSFNTKFRNNHINRGIPDLVVDPNRRLQWHIIFSISNLFCVRLNKVNFLLLLLPFLYLNMMPEEIGNLLSLNCILYLTVTSNLQKYYLAPPGGACSFFTPANLCFLFTLNDIFLCREKWIFTGIIDNSILFIYTVPPERKSHFLCIQKHVNSPKVNVNA